MRKVKRLIATASLLAAVISPKLLAAELVVIVDNIKDVKGSLYISLYNKDENFKTNANALKRQKVSVDKATIAVKLSDLPKGEYAVKAYQDVNNNGAMDFNGPTPAEPFGSSSKSKEVAPPQYNDAKFNLEENQQIQVHLLH